MGEVSLELSQSLIQRGLGEQAALRREVGEIRSPLLAMVDQARRPERRMDAFRDDIELMGKAELMGRTPWSRSHHAVGSVNRRLF